MPNFDRRAWLRLAASGAAASVALSPRQSFAQAVPGSSPSTGYPFTNLSINENQFGPSPKVKDAIVRAATLAHEYPDIPRAALTDVIAERNGLAKENVLIGAGSADILYGAGYFLASMGSKL